MIFIDSNVLAYSFYENENRERCQELVKGGGLTDTLTLIESYNIIEAEVNKEHANKSILSLLKSNLVIINIDVNVIFEALKKRTKYEKLKFLDLVHYAVALLSNCEKIASFDNDFNGLEIERFT